jgi:polycystin 1L2
MISNDVKLRIYLSGCYYMNTTTGSYQSNGTEVQLDTTVLSTHCLVYHCTEFAGGFVVLPATINFSSVFSGDNASFAKNPILYATVFSIIGLYVILAVLCRFMDIRDRNKKGLTLLNGNRIENLYEIIVFTGNRRNAGTDSNVFLCMHGQEERSHVIALKDRERKLFRRGGFDTFIVSTEQ